MKIGPQLACQTIEKKDRSRNPANAETAWQAGTTAHANAHAPFGGHIGLDASNLTSPKTNSAAFFLPMGKIDHVREPS